MRRLIHINIPTVEPPPKLNEYMNIVDKLSQIVPYGNITRMERDTGWKELNLCSFRKSSSKC